MASVNEEAVDAHNELALKLQQELSDSEINELKKLFRDCPLSPREITYIKDIDDLFVHLRNAKKISIGNYDFFIKKLRSINRRMANYVEEQGSNIQGILNRGEAGPSAAKKLKPADTSQQQSTEIHADLRPLIVQTINRIKTEKEEKKFMETKAFHDAQEKLGKNRVIMIKGNTGDGKTSTAFQLMDWLIKEQQCRQPLQLHDIKTLEKLSPDSSLVTFIDDIFGERNVRNTDVDEWNKRINNVKTLFVDQQMKANFLLVTIRNEIYNDLKERSLKPVFTKDNLIDMSSDTYRILKERKELLQKYLPNNYKWEEKEIESIVKSASSIGFPQCCHLFYNSVELQAKRGEFFEKPFEFLNEALLRLSECCAILFLFLNGGKIKVKDLDPNSDKINKTLLEESFDINLIDGEEDRTSLTYKKKVGFVKESLDRLLGFLVVKEKHWLSGDEVYRFNHDSVRVTVARLYWNKTPVGYIQNCPVKSLGYLTTSKTSTDMIVISSDHYTRLCERLLREFECEEYVYGIQSLDVWKDPEFVKRFDELLIEKKVDKRAVLNAACECGVKECGLYLLSVGAKPDNDTNWWSLITGDVVFGEGDVDVLKEVVKYLNDEKKHDLLNKACATGSTECGLYLLSVGAKPDNDTDWWSLITGGDVFDEDGYLGDVFDEDDKGDVDVLKEVVKYLNDEKKHDLLNKACDTGSTECGLYLLSVGAKPDNDTLLWVVRGGSVELLRKLLQYDVTITVRNRYNNNNVLHQACECRREEMVTELCDKYPDLVRGTNNDGLTPLYVAAGNLSIFQTVERTTLQTLYKQCGTDGHVVHRDCVWGQYMSNLVDSRGRTVLHASCEWGNKEMCVYLCEQCPSLITAVDNEGRTVLHASCEMRNKEMCVYLCEQYPSLLTAVDNEGRTVLHASCARGNKEMCVYLCEKCPSLITAVDNEGRTVLHASCARGNKEMCVYLCEKCPSLITAVDNEGRTVLHASCYWGNKEMCVYLCEQCPSLITAVDNEGRTVLHASCARGDKEMCVYLCEKCPSLLTAVDNEGRTVLHASCARGNKEMCVYLCEKCPSLITAVDNEGRTVLHASCYWGNKEMCVYLCEQCPSLITAVDNEGRTVLHASCARGDKEMCVYLCEKCPSLITAVDNEGRTVLHASCYWGNKEMCVYLCEQCPSLITAVDNEGRTVLHASCERGDKEMCVYLCEKCPSLLTAVDNEGLTVLHASCESGNKEMCVYLCEQYPSLLTAVDNEGLTVLHASCESGNKEMCVYLCEQYPSLITAVDNEGLTVLHASCESGNKEMCVYLCEKCPSLITAVDNRGRHCLHYIAESYEQDVDLFTKCETFVKQHIESTGGKYDITTILDGEGNSVLDLAKQRKERYGWLNNSLYDHLIKVFGK